MKIYILSSNPELTSTVSLRSALVKQKCQVKILNPEKLFARLHPTEVHDNHGPLPTCDLVIPRLGWKSFSHGLSLVQTFEAQGCEILNSSKSLALSHDKFTTLALLSRQHLPIPSTWIFSAAQDDYRNIKFRYPLIIKLFSGSQGMGVSIAKDEVSFYSWVDLLRSAKTQFLIQEFHKGDEIRCLIIKNQIVGCVKRTPKKGEFRSNLFLGGKATPIKLTTHEESIALESVKTLGLDFAGVDLLRGKKSTVILEVNACPGIDGISKALNKNLALPIAKAVTS